MGVKVTYKGQGIVKPFEYVCLECRHECEIEQRRSEPMDNHPCPKCSTKKKPVMLCRQIKVAPGLDADFREACKSHNLGWDGL